MVVGEASIHNIMGGMESTGGVRLHNHKRKLKQRFDIIKKLGQGTYGKVQLGINKETGQEVAIKTIKKCKIETEADLVRIRREIQIMSSVQHPNIIHIYEVFENREKMVLVMEYAAGGELYDYLSERKVLTEHEARRIFRQIATAVFYCHKHKICHRDLKLENILLDQLGNAKIADFGLSNVFDEQRLLSTFCGSPLYASPEIVKGTPYHGPEVDCWSLGVLLYTLVYGAMPFDGSNFKRLVKQISQSDYFEPKKPSPASPLIKDMLTVCPARRADIERICTHWWVNEGYEENCLDIAEDLAAQTPVRLDLLLSLVPQSASAEKLLVGDQRSTGDVVNSVSSETLMPTRCHSVGSLMELDRDNSDRRIRELLEEEPRAAPSGDAKRKLETTPSMDETAAAGVKRKERSRKKDRTEDREARTYKSASRHHSAPIPNAITEEAMEIDQAVVTLPSDSIVEPRKIESTAACLELIEECKERSPSKERGGTPRAESLPREREEAEIVAPEKEGRPVDVSVDEKKPLGWNAIEEVALPTPETPGSEDAALESRPENVSEPKPSNQATANGGQESERVSISTDSPREKIDGDAVRKESKKSREKALSLDSDGIAEARDVPAKTFERRRSKIFETAEKFNQMSSSVESEKPRKIFIPGVNVGGAKRVFERKASLSSTSTPPPGKSSAAKIIIDVPVGKKSDERQTEKTDKSENVEKIEKTEKTEKMDKPVANLEAEERSRREEAKKRAVDVIAGAIGKPPVQRRVNGSPPTSPPSLEGGKLPLKIPVAPNDARTATVSVSTPVETKFPFPEGGSPTDREATVSFGRATPRAAVVAAEPARSGSGSSQPEEPKMSTSKMEITLKSATLPRPRRTSKAEISMSGAGIDATEPPVAFKSEVEAKIDAFQPQKLRTQRSEVAFPVAAAVPQVGRSSSLEPEGKPRVAAPKERIIPIRVEGDARPGQQRSSTPPAKPPMPQRSVSQRSGSLSRQSTADSDTDSALGSTVGPEPIRKSPREYIIPIAVEGGGYVTPRSGSVEPESKTSTPTGSNPPRSRFGRPRRMSSLLSDASEDESPFSALHRDSEDLLQRHMHRLRSSRPSRQAPEHADSLSSGEDDDDDGFELLTAENLFSTLLSRVRSLTQRLNVDDDRGTGFPSTRLFGRLGSNPPQPFWGINKPLSRRLTESQFRHSFGREGDAFSRKDSAADCSNPGSPNSPGSHGTAAPSRESVFDVGSNTLPRDRLEREDVGADSKRVGKETRDKLEQNFTPCLARRLSKTLGERAVGRASSSSSPSSNSFSGSSRSCSGPLDGHRGSSRNERDSLEAGDRVSSSTSSSAPSIRSAVPEFEPGTGNELEYRPTARVNGVEGTSSRTAASGRSFSRGGSLRINRGPDKIQEETADETSDSWKDCADNGSVSEATSCSLANSTGNLANLGNPASSLSISVKSCETSPTESSSNALDRGTSSVYGMDSSRNFENRLLAAENLIKESKLKNLGPTRLDPNLASSYGDIEKCDKEALLATSRTGVGLSRRRSCIPGLRPRSGSPSGDRRRSLAVPPSSSPDRSILSKLFGPGGLTSPRDPRPRSERIETAEPNGKPRQHRISRFLRPDFFDTPREESKYAKEKEARKAAENERRKSRFIKRRVEGKENRSSADATNVPNGGKKPEETESPVKDHPGDEELARSYPEKSEESMESDRDRQKLPAKPDSRGSRGNFLRSLERKFEKLRTGEESSKPATGGARNGRIVAESRETREKSAPPTADERRSTTARRSIERATSAENVPAGKTSRCAVGKNSKSGKVARNGRVSTVLGLFRSFDSRQPTSGPKTRTSPASESSKSPPKSTTTTFSSEESSSLGKQPVKTAKSNGKTNVAATSTAGKRLREGKKSMEGGADEKEPESADRLTKGTATVAAIDVSGKRKTTRVVKKPAKKSSNGSDSKLRGKRKTDPTTEKPTKSSTSAEREPETEPEPGTELGEEAVGVADPLDRPASTRSSRAALKLDLSKIPQHAFRAAVPGKTSPKSDSPGGPPVDSARPFKTENAAASDSLVDRLSRMTHRATIAGNKIVIDKPLRAKDVAELKREVSECARLIENRVVAPVECTLPEEPMESMESIEPIERKEEPPDEPVPRDPGSEKRPSEIPEEPARTPEGSLDSWSLGSMDRSEGFGPSRRELPSPNSPSSPSSPSRSFQPRSDDSESIVDRIRRRSFYSRFNDRRRPSLTAPPPGLTLPTSTTLPRKFSFGYRDRDRDRERDRERDRSCVGRYHLGYSVSKPRLSEEIFSRDRSTDRLSSSYEPLGRYLRSPTFDSSASRSRYSSGDFATSEPDAGSPYRTSLSGLFADSLLEARPTIGSSTLPRKYGSTSEPKTIEYYEDLLAPSGSDYSPVGRTPLSADYLPRYENGYHNGGLETRSYLSRRRSCTDRVQSFELLDTIDGDLPERRRGRSERASETRSVPSSIVEPPTACPAERATDPI